MEPPAALALGKVQFLASWTGGGGPGSSQGSVPGTRERWVVVGGAPGMAPICLLGTHRQDRSDGLGGLEQK